jgi:hypothetical protein
MPLSDLEDFLPLGLVADVPLLAREGVLRPRLAGKGDFIDPAEELDCVDCCRTMAVLPRRDVDAGGMVDDSIVGEVEMDGLLAIFGGDTAVTRNGSTLGGRGEVVLPCRLEKLAIVPWLLLLSLLEARPPKNCPLSRSMECPDVEALLEAAAAFGWKNMPVGRPSGLCKT